MLPPTSSVSAEEPADGDAAAFEVEFMAMMIDHHNMANEMAAICQEEAENADLNARCDQIITDQTNEIEDMQSWLDAWYDETHEPEMTAEDEDMLAELEALSGGAFEVQFMQMMVEHHTMAIERATECEAEAQHEDLLDLCANIIATQSTEITQLEQWLCDRYDEGCPATPTAVATQQPAAVATATAPSGVVAPVRAPDTGMGGGGEDGPSAALLVILAGAGAALGGGMLVLSRAAARRG